MEGQSLLHHEELKLRIVGSSDHIAPAAQMRAVHLAMQQYFGAEDWLAVRSGVPSVEREEKTFPAGLSGESQI